MNILFIHEVDWLQKVVFDIHMLAEGLSMLGHKIFVLDFEQPGSNNSFLNMSKIREYRDANRIHEDASVTLVRPPILNLPILGRVSSLATHYFGINKIIKEKEIDAIVLYSIPTNGIQTVRIAKKHGIPVLFRSIDVIHELVPYRFLRLPISAMERWVYSSVDKILSLSHNLSKYGIDMGAKKEKVELLPFPVNTEEFKPNIDVRELSGKIGVDKDDKVLLYMGTLFDFCGVDFLIQNFIKITRKVPEARLLIVGGGPLYGELVEQTKRLKLKDDVIFTGFQPYEFMPQFINLASLCVNPFRINEATNDIIPGKIIQYLSCAKPVLATPLAGMMSMFPDENYGIIYSNYDTFVKNITELLKEDQRAQSIGQKGYNHVKGHYDEKVVFKKLETIITNLVSQN